MARVHHKIRERPPIGIMPRTEAEQRQQIIALNDEYNQLCDRYPCYDTESINYLPAGQEILQQMEITERLAGKLLNYINIKLLGTHHLDTNTKTHQITIPPTSTTRTQPKDQQVPVILSNNSHKKKKEAEDEGSTENKTSIKNNTHADNYQR